MEGSLHGGQALKNNYLYQGDFAELDEDIGWTDFELRNYDAQTGRWIQQDPFQQFNSPYSGMGNDPVNLIDPSGGWAAVGLFEGMTRAGIMITTTLGGAIVGMGVDLLSGGDGGKGALLGASIGLSSNFVGSGSVVNWSTLASTDLTKIGITTRIFSATANGVRIELLYKKSSNTTLTNSNWIQTIRTNEPLGGATSPYNDPQPSDDIGTPKPFYWTDPELLTENVSPGYDARFFDAPSRRSSSTKVVKWKAELSIVGKNAKGEYQAIGTVKYGFKIKRDGTVVVRKLRTRWRSGFQIRTIKTAR